MFEAASWALAGRRVESARRRALWLEPLPAIELANRLRRLPLFEFVPVNELVRLGAAGQQARYEPGRTISAVDDRSRTLLFLLDGAIAIGDDSGLRHVEAPAAIGVEDVLRGDVFTASVRATEISATLELPYPAFLTLLAESEPLVEVCSVLPCRTWTSRPRRCCGRRPPRDRAQRDQPRWKPR
jgi:hypothetical protein